MSGRMRAQMRGAAKKRLKAMGLAELRKYARIGLLSTLGSSMGANRHSVLCTHRRRAKYRRMMVFLRCFKPSERARAMRELALQHKTEGHTGWSLRSLQVLRSRGPM